MSNKLFNSSFPVVESNLISENNRELDISVEKQKGEQTASATVKKNFYGTGITRKKRKVPQRKRRKRVLKTKNISKTTKKKPKKVVKGKKKKSTTKTDCLSKGIF